MASPASRTAAEATVCSLQLFSHQIPQFTLFNAFYSVQWNRPLGRPQLTPMIEQILTANKSCNLPNQV
jgi:hypothetical protein